MLLRYTGTKPEKRIEYNNRVYIFAPTCEVGDSNVIKFLLDSDRKGLFVVETGQQSVVKPKDEATAKTPAEKPKPKKKKG